jgi:hypothetical protein
MASVLALVVAGAQLVQQPASGVDAAAVEGGPAPVADPLLTRDARRFEALEAPPPPPASSDAPSRTAAAKPASARVDFADGSSIEATPGARVEALASSPGEFRVAVRRGLAQFRVTPGGPRRWRIEASHAQVEVLGTVLWVESDAAGTSVRVDVGSVLVRSAELPGGSRRVAAGESVRLGAPSGGHEAGGETPPSEPATPEAAPGKAGAEDEAAPLEPSRRRQPARLGVVRHSAAALWEGADEARRTGQTARAAALLERLIERHPEDSQVALAAFTLGVLQLDRLQRPLDAADSFQLALELGIGAALRDDAYLRWAEALSQVRDRVRLVRVSAEYARLYPRGRHRSAIDQLARSAAAGPARRAAPHGASVAPPHDDP